MSTVMTPEMIAYVLSKYTTRLTEEGGCLCYFKDSERTWNSLHNKLTEQPYPIWELLSKTCKCQTSTDKTLGQYTRCKIEGCQNATFVSLFFLDKPTSMCFKHSNAEREKTGQNPFPDWANQSYPRVHCSMTCAFQIQCFLQICAEMTGYPVKNAFPKSIMSYSTNDLITKLKKKFKMEDNLEYKNALGAYVQYKASLITFFPIEISMIIVHYARI